MTAKVIDGKAIAQAIRAEQAKRVERLHLKTGVTPGLAVVLVGGNPASKVYVRNKRRACDQVGVESFSMDFPVSIETRELVEHIESLNAREDVHGILVQLPLPEHVEMRRVLEAIDVTKDVDGFHLYDVGGLVVGQTVFAPCTPYGVLEPLAYEGIDVEGKNVVAAGVPNLIRAEMVRSGAVVIDVGINRLPDNSITGDVDFEAVRQKASYITPVPGGVGPMTVTMLLENTISAAERAAQAIPTELGLATV